MFDWLKPKKNAKSEAKPKDPAAPQSREEIVAAALKNAQSAREAIGAENLQKLAQMIQNRTAAAEDVSPAAQAKKIIAHMDKGKVSDFLKFVVQEDQTKH